MQGITTVTNRVAEGIRQTSVLPVTAGKVTTEKVTAEKVAAGKVAAGKVAAEKVPGATQKATGSIPWTGLLAVTICGSCAFLNLYATQPLLPLLVKYFHSSQGDVSLTVSATSFGVALAAPFIGKFSDGIGRKKIIIPAIFLLMIPTILAGLTSDVWQLIACRFAQGLILPAIFAVTMAYVAEEWHEYGLGFAMAMYVSGNVVGGFLGRLVSGLVAANFGWRQAFFVLAALNLIGGLLAWALLPSSKKFIKTKTAQSFINSSIGLLQNKKLVASFAVGCNILFSLVAAFTYVTFHLSAAPFNLDGKCLSWLFSVYLIGAFITPFAGKFIDRLGFRTALLAALGISVAGLLMTLSSSLPVILCGLATTSAALFICQSATTTSLRNFAPHANSTAAGLYVFFYYTGGSMGGYLPSLFWNLGGWNACVYLIIACHAMAIACAYFFWKKPTLMFELA
jgi:MFS transporter, YNFM family, putative membrane transport protein